MTIFDYENLFWSKVDKTNDCWLWTAAKDANGYGKYSIAKIGNFRAHRLSLMYRGITIPKGYVVMHKCDNPSCVNPEHLQVGTIQENNLDKLTKNRQSKPKGMRNSRSKLTDDQVREIKSRAIVGHRSGYNNGSNLKQLAEEFNVSIETIRLIANTQTWSHI